MQNIFRLFWKETAVALGYDLVAFQDHPYQPAFLDTRTLMDRVAARRR